MDRRTDIAGFYDHLAPVYDRMTDPAGRAGREMPAFRKIVDRYRIGSAVDAGSGTGFHAFLLSQLGVSTTAVDVSPVMLTRLTEEAERLGLQIPAVQSSLEMLSRNLSGPVDAVFCMGNTLAHLLSSDLLRAAIGEFSAITRPGGLVMLQLLNYERILARRERIQNVREEAGGMIVRFYDFGGELLRFNILRLERRDGKIAPDLSSIDLRPVLRPELTEALEASGYEQIQAYGSVGLDPFESMTSPDLVMLAIRHETRNRS